MTDQVMLFRLTARFARDMVKFAGGEEHMARGTIAAALIDIGLRMCLEAGMTPDLLMEQLHRHIELLQESMRREN